MFEWTTPDACPECGHKAFLLKGECARCGWTPFDTDEVTT